MVIAVQRLLENLQQFFSGWRFAVTMLSLLISFVAFMLVVLVLPRSIGVAGEFAEAFRVWCFGYDRATGGVEWGYLWMYVIQPLALGGMIFLLWQRPLRRVLAKAPRHVLPYVGSAMVFVVFVALGLFSLTGWQARAADPTEFPASRIRTSLVPPPFELTDQHGAPVSLNDLRGRVVMITAVYASCGQTCPMVMAQTRGVLATVPEALRDDLSVLAITLDPEHDTPEVLAGLVKAQGFEAPLVRALTGSPAYVNQVLDAYQFARRRNAKTGVIEHANLFILIDRDGRIAYRFSLGEQQEAWLAEALQLLLLESARAS